MKKWVTEIKAIDPRDGILKTWHGEFIEAPTKKLAQDWCNNNERGYLNVTGELLAIIPTKQDGYTPDYYKKIDYENINLN